MSVEYSSEAAYGIAGMRSERPSLLRDLSWYDDEEPSVDSWLFERGFDKLEWHTGGDTWTGRCRWAIIAEGSLYTLRDYNNQLITSMHTPSSDAIRQLLVLEKMFDETYEVGWKLFFNIF
jgi:hypothetical protein